MALYIKIFTFVSLDKLDYSSKAWNTLHDFCLDFPPIYSLEMLMLVAESQSQSADLSWQIS